MHRITYRIWKSRYAMTEKFRLSFKYFDKSQFSDGGAIALGSYIKASNLMF